MLINLSLSSKKVSKQAHFNQKRESIIWSIVKRDVLLQTQNKAGDLIVGKRNRFE